MSNDGKNILTLMNEIRNLCEQIAMLMGTADQIVGKDNWISANGSTITGGNSASINNHRGWIPEFLCRFYLNKKYPQILLYIAVILDIRNSDEYYALKNKGRFEEPIITAGYYDYGNKKVGHWRIWCCRNHVYSDDPDYKGEIYTTIPKEPIYSPQDQNFDKLISLAIPLTNIQNSTDLEKMVIEPLFRNMKASIQSIDSI